MSTIFNKSVLFISVPKIDNSFIEKIINQLFELFCLEFIKNRFLVLLIYKSFIHMVDIFL